MSPRPAAARNASTTSRAAASAAVAGAPSRIRARARRGEHLRGRRAAAEYGGDRVERDLEHVMQDERHPLSRRKGVHDDVQRETDGVREQGLLLGTGPRPHPARASRR